jgi:hypothetical protein
MDVKGGKPDVSPPPIEDGWVYFDEFSADDCSVKIELSDLGNVQEMGIGLQDVITTSISCNVVKEGGVYTLRLTIFGKSFIIKTTNDMIVQFIMKEFLRLGYFRLRLINLTENVSSFLAGDSALARGVAKYILHLFIRSGSNDEVYRLLDGLEDEMEKDLDETTEL